MPLKLKIPFDARGYPALRLGGSPLKARGKAARLRREVGLQAEACNREAQMQVTFICYSLWAGFWFQFVVGILYNMPAIHTLSGGNWYAPDYEFYIETPGSFPFSSVAENFVFYSVFGSAVAIVFGWIFTKGVAGKWRLRFAVAIFVTIILGWSIAAHRAEEAAWTVGMDQRISKARREWRWVADEIDREGGGYWQEYRLRTAREKVEKLESLKKSRGVGGE